MAARDAALDMLMRIPGSRRLTVGADRGYDSRDFVSECRDLNITPHAALKILYPVIDAHTTQFKSVGPNVHRFNVRLGEDGERLRQSRYRGVERTGRCRKRAATAYNLVRMSRLIAEEEPKVPIVAYPSLREVCLSDLVGDEHAGICAT